MSYVFFKSLMGATGSLGSPLTAKRNIAVDRSVILELVLNTTNPVDKTN